MNKHKWHSKLVNLAVAFALVFSLVGIAVMPVGAQNGAKLGVSVDTDKDTYCCSENITVTATISNSGSVTAVNVTGSISWIPSAALSHVSGPSPAWGFNISDGGSQQVTWILHCKGPGSATIKVEAQADGVSKVFGQKTILQESAELEVNITYPDTLCDRSWLVCNTYNLTFTIENVGCSSASLVTATISPDAHIEVVVGGVGKGGGVPWTTPTLGTLLPGGSKNWTQEMHCVDAHLGSMIHVVPNGVDACTGRQIGSAYLHSDIVEINQYEPIEVECDAKPNPTKVCHNVTFTASATGGIPPYSWNWTFGDENWTAGSGTPIEATHHYTHNSTNPVVYTYCVTVSDDCGNSDICCHNITVNPPLEMVSCNATPNPTKVGYPTDFTVTHTGGVGPYTYSWSFGDGAGTSTLQNPTGIKYTTAGNWTYCVNVTDSLKNLVTCCHNITVHDELSVSCNATPNPTKVCHNVTFTGTASGGFPAEACNYTWEWDFGDDESQSGTGYSPIEAIHHYGKAGNYTATLTLSDDCLNNTATCNVTVEVYDKLSVNCTADPLHTKVGDEVTFSATRIGGLPEPPASYTWDWDFGDGTAHSPNNPTTHSYSNPATYVATVILNDGTALNNTACCVVEVVIEPPLSVNCSAEDGTVCNAVQFHVSASGGLGSYNYTWNFGDPYATMDNPNTSTDKDPTHTYMCASTYTYIVTVTDIQLGNTENCTHEVTITIPTTFNLTAPESGAQLTSKNVTFEWEDIGCVDYTITVFQKPSYNVTPVVVVDEDVGKNNTYTHILFNDDYGWYVIAKDACNNTAQSATQYFQVDAPETKVTVMSPNGGEVWAPGSAQSITWTATPTDGIIALYYSSDGGATWTLIKGGEDNDGAYPWTVPAIESAQCLVKVVVSDPASGSAEDTSDGLFTIGAAPVVTVLSPNGGESYAGGSSQNITWTASDNVGVTSIDLYFSSNGGAEWAVIALGEANDGTYSWVVPTITSSQCLVKVTASDAIGLVGSDTSDAVFTITEGTPPSVKVKYPNGGETFRGGTQATITWAANDYWLTGSFGTVINGVDHIDLYYKYDGGSWTSIATGQTNYGEYLWTVPDINSTRCLIRVDATDAAGNVGSDTSDGVFTITSEPVCPASYNITLVAGWNLISLPLIPTNSTIEAVLAGVSGVGSVTQVHAWDAQTQSYLSYIAGLGGTLTTMEDGPGYWVSANGTATLTVTGDCMPEPPNPPRSYEVYAGWNLIGIKSVITRTHDDYLYNVAGKYSVIWGYDGAYSLVFPSPPGTGQMPAGSGFWIWMTQDGTIVPPGN